MIWLIPILCWLAAAIIFVRGFKTFFEDSR
jgi:hypothetical protein